MEQTNNLIIKYLSKNISVEEQTILLKWLEESDDNKKYFRSLKDTYDLGLLEANLKESHVKKQWTKILKTINKSPKTQTPKRRKTAYFTIIRYAAIFIGGVFCLQLFNNLSNKTTEVLPMITKIETGAGDKTRVTLPDGSIAWINACSSITYNNKFGESCRKVKLEGEAYFEVKTDSIKPFIVQTNNFSYKVTGTSFNVYSYDNDNETSIALLEGGVTAEYEKHSIKILPGEVLSFNKTTGKLTVQRNNVNLLSSWRYGEFIFENMTFEELATRLERMFNVHFVFENKDAINETFGGTIRFYDSLETIIKVIQTSKPLLEYHIEDNIIYIK